MPLDKQLFAAMGIDLPGQPAAGLDPEVMDFSQQFADAMRQRRILVRDTHLGGLTSTLTGVRDCATDKAAKEVTSPRERQELIEDVTEASEAMGWVRQREYEQSGFLGKFGKRAQQVGEGFVSGGSAMYGALKFYRDWSQNRGPTVADVRFKRDLQRARNAGDPTIRRDDPLTLRGVQGGMAMAPDLSAGLLAGGGGGRWGMFAYWTARLFPERMQDYLEAGHSQGDAVVAGAVTAAAESAIELLNIAPPGVRQLGRSKFGQGVVRRGISDVIERFGGKQFIATVQKYPVVGKAIGGAVDALERIGIEITEEGMQAGTRRFGQYLAAKHDPKISGPAFSEIAPEMWQEMKDTAPAIFTLGGVTGGGMAAGEFAVSRQDAKAKKVRDEIVEYADQGKVPSRRKRVEWGLPEEGWESRQQRREGVEVLAEEIKAEERIQREYETLRQIGETTPGWAQAAVGMATEAAPSVMGPSEVAATRGDVGPVAEEEFVTPEVMPDVMGEQGEAPLRSEENVQAGPAPGEHGMAVEATGTGEAVSARKIVVDLEKLWDAPLMRGHMGGSKAAAFYKRHEGIIRLSRGYEAKPAIAMHEIAHKISDKFPLFMKGLSDVEIQELGGLDYDQDQRRPFEGFAEFVRAYVTGSTHLETDINLQEAAPEFYENFQNVVSADREMSRKLTESKAMMDRFRRAGAVGRVKGQIGQPDPTLGLLSTRERTVALVDYVYMKFKEEGLPIKRFVQEAEKHGYYAKEGEMTAFEEFNGLRRTGEHFAASALEDGVFLLSGTMQKAGPSLKEALDEIEVGEDYEDFRAWAYANHAIESWSKGKDPGITLEDAKIVQAELANPRYERAAQQLTEFGNALIVVLEDVGEISHEESEFVRGYYETHVPLLRVQEGKLTRGTSMRKINSPALRGRSGSGLPVQDFVESLLIRAIETYNRASQRRVLNNLVATAETTKGMGPWVERVPPEMVPTEFKPEEVKAQLSPALVKAGIDPEEVFAKLDPMTALSIWRPQMVDSEGHPIYRRIVGEKVEYWRVRSDIQEALGGLETHHTLDIATSVARRFMGALKIGATRFNPSFVLLTNPAKDYQTFLLQGEKGLKGAADPAGWAAAWVYSEIQRATGNSKGDPVCGYFRKMGGELSTYAGLDRHRLKQGVKYAKTGRHGWATIGANITGTPEVAPRLAEFAAVLDRQGWLEKIKNGEEPPIKVLLKAVSASHDVTVDFRRMGPWGRYLNYWVPFSNAKFEGLDKFVRTFKDHPTRSMIRVATQIIPLTLLYWWLRHDDDDYKERPEWMDGFWTFIDENGRAVIRIPRSHEWGLLSSGIERMMDTAFDKDPDAITRWFKQAGRTTIPDTYPVGVTTVFETMFNYDHFRKRAIVPEYMQQFEPVDQYHEYNTGLVKHAAKFMYDYSGGKVNLSPAKMEHMADGLTGGMYTRVERPIEKALSGDPWAAHDVPGLKGILLRREYTKSMGDIYAIQKTLTQQKNSAKKHDETFPVEKRADLHRIERTIRYIAKLRKRARGQPDDVREQSERGMTGAARTGLGRPPLATFPDPRSIENSLPELP